MKTQKLKSLLWVAQLSGKINLKKNIFILILTIIGFAVILASYMGLFRPVHIQIDKRPAMHLLYKNYMGPYHKIVPTLEAVEKWAKSNGIQCHESFGEFLDDPKSVEESRLRAKSGCLLSEEEKTKITSKLPNSFLLESYPETKAIKVIFEGSPAVGPIRVYSKVQSFAADSQFTFTGAPIEIYNIDSQTNGMITTYYFPIKKKED